MKTQFTKGQWFIDKLDGSVNVTTFEKNVCKLTYGRAYDSTEEEMHYNAQLISAAPDLFEALINIENDDNRIPATIWEMRNKALNKALGEDIFKTKAE